MANHAGTWVKENDPIITDHARLKLVNPDNGTRFAILDCTGLPDPLPAGDTLTVTTPVQRSYEVLSQVAPMTNGAVRVMVKPVTYVAL